MNTIPPLFRDALVAGMLLLLFAALGRRALRLGNFGLGPFRPLEAACVYTALGAGLAQYLPFALGAAGILSPWSLRFALGGLALLVAPDAAQLLRRLPDAARELRSAPISKWVWIWTSVIGLFLIVLFIRGLLVGAFGDDDGYHLTAPKRWLDAGTLEYLPTYTHTNAPMGFEMLYMMALALSGPGAAKALNFGAGIFCLLGIFSCASRLGQPIAGFLVVACMLFENPLFDLPVLLNLAFVDLAVAWMTIAAALIWLVWRSVPGRGDLLIVAGLCAGFAGSFKFTALATGGALVLLLALDGWRSRQERTITCVRVAGVAVASFVPVVPWLVRNWHVTGNPVYPLFSSLIPARDWSVQQEAIFQSFFRYFNWQRGAGIDEAASARLLFIVALGVLAAYVIAIFLEKRHELRGLLILSAVLLASGFGVTGLFWRFYLPAFFLTALVVASWITARVRADLVLVAATLIGLAGIGKWGNWAAQDVPVSIRTAFGLAEAPRDDPFWNVWHYLNENTPKHAHVMLAAIYSSFKVSSGVAFWVNRRTFTTDPHLQNAVTFEDWPSFLRSVARIHVDFVVIAREPPEQLPYFFRTFTGGRNEYPFSRRLVNDYGTLLFQSGEISVYRIALSSEEYTAP